MKRRIVIADINSRCTNGVLTGHGYAVAENYRQLSDECTEVVVAGGPVYKKRFPDAIELDYDTDAAFSDRENKRRNLHNIKQLFKLCPNDIIVFQSCAVVTGFLGIALYKPKGCRVFSIQYNAEGVGTPLKRMIYAFARKKIDGIVCSAESVGEAYGRPYCAVPDYIYSASGQKGRVPYADKKYDFCMVGMICPDKGSVEAARILAGKPYRVLVAGRAVSTEIADELTAIAQRADNIDLQLGYLSEEKYAAALAESRYCILNYQGAYSLHSSGVVYDTLFNGVPVLGKRCEALRLVEEHGLGVLCDELRPEIFADILTPEKHHVFCEHINRYYVTHLEHRRRLMQFLSSSAAPENHGC